MSSLSVESGDSRRGENLPLKSVRKMSGNQLTARAVVVGLLVGFFMCGTNMYFGLQSGWGTLGSIQSAVLGFGAFKALQRCGLGRGFTVTENVIIQTTSVATATMPFAAGFVSVIPALGMLNKEDSGSDPVNLSYPKMILWGLALAFFGVFVAIPLRNQTILREKLRFPTGSATAKVIEILHQSNDEKYLPLERQIDSLGSGCSNEDGNILIHQNDSYIESSGNHPAQTSGEVLEGNDTKQPLPGVAGDWWLACKTVLISFAISFVYKLLSEWVVVCHRDAEGTKNCDAYLKNFPIFTWIGMKTITQWGWTLSPQLGYVGQGMIMGPRTCVSMLGGALLGFTVLGPIAKKKGWAPGTISSTRDGATGWVLWVSLAIMLGDSLTSLALLTWTTFARKFKEFQRKNASETDLEPPEHKIPAVLWLGGLGGATVLSTTVLSMLFSMPIYEPVLAVGAAALVAILAVRALGETDLNPASGVGKLSQILFATVAPGNVVSNIVAGAVAEAGAIQAGDMMQDFKTAHLLGVPPRPQFASQLIGSIVSVFFSVGAYALFSKAWTIPGEDFPAPSANIWIDMALLLNGGSLPEKVLPFACVGAVLAAVAVVVLHIARTTGNSEGWSKWIPSGIGFAVGMYIGPKYTIPRVIGSLAEQIWLRISPSSHSALMVVVASGLVLGEGTGAITAAFVKAFRNSH